MTTTFTIDKNQGVATDRTGGPGCSSCGDAGNRTQKRYDDYLNLIDVIDGSNVTTHMTYDSGRQGNVLSRTENFCNPNTQNCSGVVSRTTTYAYNSSQAANLGIPDFIAVPSTGTCSLAASQNGQRVTTLTLDSHGNVTDETIKGCNGTANVQQSTSYTYLADVPYGRLHTANGPRTDVQDITTYDYFGAGSSAADLGRLHTITDALGHVTTLANYDYFGNIRSVTDPNGVETTYTYDGRDRVTEVRINGSSPTNAPAVPDIVTQYHYDGAGNLDFVRLPKCVAFGSGCASSFQYVYDGVNRLTEVHDSLGNKIIHGYDVEGNLIREEYKTSSAAPKRFTNFAFDSFNRPQYVQFNDSPSAPTTGAIYFGYTYFPDGTRETEQDPKGHVSSFTYDKFKRLKTVAQTVGTETLTTTYDYDSQDNLISVTDPRGLVTHYTYGDLGWKLSESSPDTGHTLHTYDDAGNLLTTATEDGHTVTRQYDELNRLTTTRYDDSDLDLENFYDSSSAVFGIGRKTGMTDASGDTAYTYDRRGLVLQEEKTIRSFPFDTNYEYDPNGNLREIRYPSAAPSLRRGIVDFDHDAADRVSLVTAHINGDSATIATGFDYMPFGPRSALSFGNTLADSRTFDTRYQPIDWTLGSLLSYTHGFDNDGNLTGLTDHKASTNTRTFDYDDIHRLTSASGPWGTANACPGTKTYIYDANGNRTCRADLAPAISYTYDTHTNHLHTSSEGSGITFSSDDTGRITSDGAHAFQYSAANRLATVDSGATAFYSYDGENRRASKSTSDGRTYFFYDPSGRLLTELVVDDYSGASGGKDYVYLDGAPIARLDWMIPSFDGDCPPVLGECDPPLPTEDLYFYHTDHLGTPIAMTDFNADLVWRAEYRPFGDLFSNTVATVGNNLRFAGQYFDSETGLHQNWFRDYSPRTGRYLAPDPLGLSGGPNMYAYGNQRPTRYVDRLGLMTFADFGYGTADAVVGFGDTVSRVVTLGFWSTSDFRDWQSRYSSGWQGVSGEVNKCSSGYAGGKYAGYAWAGATAWTAGLYGGARSVFWSGYRFGAKVAAEALGGTTLEATPWGSFLEYLQYRSGLSLPSWLFDPAWRVASATFALNASGTVRAVIRDPGLVWTTIEYPILNWRGIPVEYLP